MKRCFALVAFLAFAEVLAADQITCTYSSNGSPIATTPCMTAGLFTSNDTLNWQTASQSYPANSLAWSPSSTNGLSVGVYSGTLFARTAAQGFTVDTNGTAETSARVPTSGVDRYLLDTGGATITLTFDDLNPGFGRVFTGINSIGFYLSAAGYAGYDYPAFVDALLFDAQLTAFDVNNVVVGTYAAYNASGGNCVAASYGSPCDGYAPDPIDENGHALARTSSPFVGVSVGSNKIRTLLIQLSPQAGTIFTATWLSSLHIDWDTSDVIATPEPAVAFLIGSGLLGLGLLRRRAARREK